MICAQPKVVSDTDEIELAAQLERLAQENQEVSGDEGSEEEEEVGMGGPPGGGGQRRGGRRPPRTPRQRGQRGG